MIEHLIAAGARLGISAWVRHAQLAGRHSIHASGGDSHRHALLVLQNGSTALHAAAREGHDTAVAALVGHGADVSVADAAGCTPLHCAAGSTSSACVALLLRAGAEADARDEVGEHTCGSNIARRH